MPLLGGRGKKQAEPLQEGDRGFGRPSGLISPFEVAWDAPMNELTEITMAAGIPAAQGDDSIGRSLVGYRRLKAHPKTRNCASGNDGLYELAPITLVQLPLVE
jgi:hypothetical protein